VLVKEHFAAGHPRAVIQRPLGVSEFDAKQAFLNIALGGLAIITGVSATYWLAREIFGR